MPKMGEVCRVINKERQENYKKRFGEDSTYFSIYIEDDTGDKEDTILLTDKEFFSLRRIQVSPTLKKDMVNGRLYNLIIGKRTVTFVKLYNEGQASEPYVVQIKSKLIEKAIKRGNNHPNTTPKKSWLQDALD